MSDFLFEHRGQKWKPQSFAVCMAWDAFRIAIGLTPRNFTFDEVIVWLKINAALDKDASK